MRDRFEVVLKAIGLGLAIAVIVLGILDATTNETNILLLAIGLLAVALTLFRRIQ